MNAFQDFLQIIILLPKHISRPLDTSLRLLTLESLDVRINNPKFCLQGGRSNVQLRGRSVIQQLQAGLGSALLSCQDDSENMSFHKPGHLRVRQYDKRSHTGW